MRISIIAVLVAAAGNACLVARFDKDGCNDSRDCLGNRVCVDLTCVDAPCDALCTRLCEQLVDCGVESDADCGAACIDRDGLLASLPTNETVCRDHYEANLGGARDCDEIRCSIYCGTMCQLAQTCDAIADLAACELGCAATNASGCDPHAPTTASCEDVEAEARCAVIRAAEGPDADCIHIRCEDDYDCPATHKCESNDRCYPRCLENYECGAGECYLDICTDPVGTPCDDDSCGTSGYCINVDADNLTTRYYCTRYCGMYDPCPGGSKCVDSKCRLCAGGACGDCGDQELCSYLDDGTCDEPEGSGLCADGTDPCDCG